MLFVNHIKKWSFLFFVTHSQSVYSALPSQDFPITGHIAQQSDFWEKIFTQLPSTSSLIHDMNHPNVLLDLIDHHKIAKQKNRKLPSLAQQASLTEAYLNRYKEALNHFKIYGEKAKHKSLIEMRVYEVYKRQRKMSSLLKGRAKIRSQAGLSDQFILGGSRSQNYLHQMEDIFREYNVPEVITRLSFVESMFNNQARSKVGASGVWQFMKPTAKNFIIVDKFIDERNSPLKATRAAAQLLSENYKLLGTWPLAITAYNHGPTGLRKAVKKFRTKDLNTIISQYKSSTFGYASRNFYSEFVAAARSYQKYINQGLITKPDAEKKFYEIKPHKRRTIPNTLKAFNISWSTFRSWNPGMTQQGYRYYQNNLLPKKYKIIVPASSLHSAKKHNFQRR
ncbi:MAG: lytic transglycosylase domain-containing protein [Oligoflexales bacterium]